MSAVLLIMVCGALNRLAGSFADWFPSARGRGVYYVAPAMGFLSLLWAGAVYYALLVGVAYLMWRLPAWGHLYGLGRYRPNRPISRLEAILLKVSRENYHVAFTLRHLFGVPMLIALPIQIGMAFAVLLMLCYETAWRLQPDHNNGDRPITLAEWFAGMMWGAMIIVGSPS